MDSPTALTAAMRTQRLVLRRPADLESSSAPMAAAYLLATCVTPRTTAEMDQMSRLKPAVSIRTGLVEVWCYWNVLHVSARSDLTSRLSFCLFSVGPEYKCDEDTEFSCKTNYRCVPQWARCDGTNDCLDNSDEEGCGQFLPATSMFDLLVLQYSFTFEEFSTWLQTINQELINFDTKLQSLFTDHVFNRPNRGADLWPSGRFPLWQPPLCSHTMEVWRRRRLRRWIGWEKLR